MLLRLSAAALSGRGLVRKSNEDAVWLDGKFANDIERTPCRVQVLTDDIRLFMVADGMGGHAAGATASEEALRFLGARRSLLADPATCSDALKETNWRMYELMEQMPNTLGMGCTVVGAAIREQEACVFNVGDSRFYVKNASGVRQGSIDDALLGKTADGARRKLSPLVTQSLGGGIRHSRIEPHVAVVEVLPGDTLLLCSDGLTDVVPDASIDRILDACKDESEMVLGLYEAALSAGAPDNVSVLVLVASCAAPR